MSDKNFFLTLIVVILIVLSFGAYKYYLHNSRSNQSEHYQMGCNILSPSGNIIWYSEAYLCAFLNDGSFFTAGTDGLRYHSKTDDIVWYKNDMSRFHKLVLSEDRRYVLSIGSEKNIINDELIRSDVFEVTDKNGITVKRWSVFENLNALKQLGLSFFKSPPQYGAANWAFDPKVKKEITHANSFQEINSDVAIYGSSIWKPGNYLVYLYGPVATALVLDSEMKKILWHFDFAVKGKSTVHDLQLVQNGNILLYYNFTNEFLREPHYSSLVLADPITMHTKWNYNATPPESFFSDTFGGVQQLENGNFLYSITKQAQRFPDEVEIAHEVTPLGQRVFSIKSPYPKNRGYQEIKQIDATEFLKNNQMYK